MTLICLIGKHGSGKSAIGRELVKKGFAHVSIGLLRRLATNGIYPHDVPRALLLGIRRLRPGTPLNDRLATQLVDFVSQHPKCVLDGFPASLRHLSFLPPETVIGIINTRPDLRISRLMQRSEETVMAHRPQII